MSVFLDNVVTEEISRESYVQLERKLQDLRLRVMRLAAFLSTNPSAIPTSRRPITRQDVWQALSRFAECGLSWSGQSNVAVGDFPQDTYMYLEKRLHSLRRFIIRWAGKFAREENQRQYNDVVQIQPAHISAAWDKIASDSAVLHTVLLSDESPRD